MEKKTYLNRNKTLTELEQSDWGKSTDNSYLITTCHWLRYKPIGEFSTEDFRIMIGQNIGTQYLVPLALEILEQDPFAEGNYYRGDLLCNVLAADPLFYKQRPDLRQRLNKIIDKAHANMNKLDEIDQETINKPLFEAIKKIQQIK